MTRPLLSYRDFHLVYGGTDHAVRGVSFDILPGQCLALVGESGCGKTSMARAATGLLPAAARARGSIRFRGEELLGAGEKRLRALRGREIAYVAQDPFEACDPLQPIFEHVAEAWRAHGEKPDPAEIERRLEAIGIEDAGKRMWQYPHQWSGGMLQRASIVAASIHHPPLIVADEPTSALDTDRADATLRALRVQGSSILLVSHDLGLVADHADIIAVCYAGRIVELASASEVSAAPRHPYSKGLRAALPTVPGHLPQPMPGSPPRLDQKIEGCAFAPRCPISQPDCTTVDPALIDGIACIADPSAERIEELAEHLEITPAAPHDGTPVVHAEGLSKSYGLVRAFQAADLTVTPGEIVGISGPSGCGKSTLLRLLGSIEPPSTGTLRFGFEADAGPRRRLQVPPGYIMPIFQDPLASLDPRWPIWRSITEPQTVGARRLSRAERRDKARRHLSEVGLDHIDPEARPLELSVGQCQRVSIARALAAEPALVVADEPTSALDASATATVLHLLADLAKRGTAIVIVSHNRPLLDSLCNRVLSMDGGCCCDTGLTDTGGPAAKRVLSAPGIRERELAAASA